MYALGQCIKFRGVRGYVGGRGYTNLDEMVRYSLFMEGGKILHNVAEEELVCVGRKRKKIELAERYK